MRYGSVCSGVESATLAWEHLGWKPEFFSEIDPFLSEVLKQRFPEVTNVGDFTKIGDSYRGTVDLIVGGTPCQSFSTAGQRTGLQGVSGLARDFIRLCYESESRWFVWENVPGVLSSNKGRDFAALLSSFTGLDIEPPSKGWKNTGFIRNTRPDRYGVAWRVLDAQYTRVDKYPYAIPQRRRRLFLIGYIGVWQYPVQVLLDPKVLLGDNPPRRERRPRTPLETEGGVKTTNYGIGNGQVNGAIRPVEECCRTLTCMSSVEKVLICQDTVEEEAVALMGDGAFATFSDEGVYPTVTANAGQAYVCTNGSVIGVGSMTVCAQAAEEVQTTLTAREQGDSYICYEWHGSDSRAKEVDVSPTITANAGTGRTNLPLVQDCNSTTYIVRKLLPVECERLMGFPDGYTQIKWRGKDISLCPDGHRYKACGNSMCVNVMMAIGEKIDKVEKIIQQEGLFTSFLWWAKNKDVTSKLEYNEPHTDGLEEVGNVEPESEDSIEDQIAYALETLSPWNQEESTVAEVDQDVTINIEVYTGSATSITVEEVKERAEQEFYTNLKFLVSDFSEKLTALIDKKLETK